MAKVSHTGSSAADTRTIRNPLQTQSSAAATAGLIQHFHISRTQTRITALASAAASLRKNQPAQPQIKKKANNWKAPRRRVITISSPSGGWPGKWTCDYIVSLKDLQLQDLADDGDEHTQVYISLCLHKHAGFGLSVDGRIITAIPSKCSNCSAPYYNEIDTNFNVWVLPPSKEDPSAHHLPDLGGDPSVIYVKPGCDADLDSLVRDTIRLQISIKETCSESCENAEPKLQYTDAQRTAYVHKQWSGLIELRKRLS